MFGGGGGSVRAWARTEVGLRHPGYGGGYGHGDDEDDDDSDGDYYDDDSAEDEEGMQGFSAREVEELLAQGVKPWLEDALDVMAVLGCDFSRCM